jgi:hypothetical protein
MGKMKKEIFKELDKTWFDECPDKWLRREDFCRFQDIAGVDFKDLFSQDFKKVKGAQERIVAQTTIFNEIQREHAGFRMPLLYYTHDYRFSEPLPEQNPDLERISYQLDMGDSLRRRHLALSHVIFPEAIKRIKEEKKSPIVIGNLGSGIGLDMINAVKLTNSSVESVLNYDTNQEAISLGTKIVSFLEKDGQLKEGTIKYFLDSMTRFKKDSSDLIAMIGVICGLKDDPARGLLKIAHSFLRENGEIVVSSSNYHMLKTDPLANFLAQHIGTRQDPSKGWGLNFRTERTMRDLLFSAGFSSVDIYDDANYPGKEELDRDIYLGKVDIVDRLPSQVFYKDKGRPSAELDIPSRETLDRRIGYNWIAVAKK